MRRRAHADVQELVGWLVVIAFALLVLGAAMDKARSHEIYTGVKGKDGQLCCVAQDCEPTVYEERRGEFYFMTRAKHWVRIPDDRITYLPVPGDEDVTTHNHAHLCYRDSAGYEVNAQNVFPDDAGNSIYLYCAFIPPGAT